MTPVVAIAPLLLIYLPQPLAVLACAWIVAFFPVLANTTLGLNSVDHNLLALFELYRRSRWQVLWNLKLPAALPHMLAGLRIAGGLSLIGAVVAEIAAGSAGAGSGLAYRIAESGYRLNIPRMFAALLLLSLAGVAIFFALSAISHLCCAAGTRARSRASARLQAPSCMTDAERRHRHHDLDQAAVQAERQHGRDRRQRGRAQIERQRIEGIPAQRAGVHFGDFAEQHMQREPDRQIEDDADHGGGDRGKRAGQLPVGAQSLDERRAGENPQHRRHERHPGRHRRAEHARGDRRERRGVAERREEADELRDQDQRPRRGFGKAQAVDHFRRRHPAVGLAPPPAPYRRAAHRRRRSSPPRAWRKTCRCSPARVAARR